MTHLLWCDLETTGLEPFEKGSQVLEIGAKLTDMQLNTIWDYHSVVCFSDESAAELLQSNRYVYDMHTENHLLAECATTDKTIGDIAEELVLTLQADKHRYGWKKGPLLAGSSVHFDRKWMEWFMPEVTEALHYRNFDISSLYPFCQMVGWSLPSLYKPHRAVLDLEASIDELKHILAIARE